MLISRNVNTCESVAGACDGLNWLKTSGTIFWAEGRSHFFLHSKLKTRMGEFLNGQLK